jgi:hypothetical protein
MHRLAPILDQLDRCALECDGLTLLISSLLSRAGEAHTRGIGGIVYTLDGRSFAPHLWIDLADGWRIDYRARMWLRERPDVPHGVFRPAGWPQVAYDGYVAPPIADDDLNAAILALAESIDLESLAEQIRQLK